MPSMTTLLSYMSHSIGMRMVNSIHAALLEAWSLVEREQDLDSAPFFPDQKNVRFDLQSVPLMFHGQKEAWGMQSTYMLSRKWSCLLLPNLLLN